MRTKKAKMIGNKILYSSPAYDRMDDFDKFYWGLIHDHDNMIYNIIAWPGNKKESMARIDMALEDINHIRRILGVKPFTKEALILAWKDIYGKKRAAYS